MKRNPQRIAFVVDALAAYSGAERVLETALELFPSAPIYSLVYNPSALSQSSISKHEIHTSWIQNLPGGLPFYRNYLPLLPLAIEQFDLRNYDIVLSFSYAVAHGVICRPDQLHISYTFAPLRYAWQNAHEYFQHGLFSPLSRLTLHYLRLWDKSAASRVDHFVAISNWTAACIRRAYQREAEVIYPPLESNRFKPLSPRGNYYVAFSRLVRHKRMEIIVEAFSKLGRPLVVIGEGPERKRLEALAGPNVKLLGWQSNEVSAEIVGRARALVHAAEEDFGLVLAEAQAAGCPVIAYGGGSAGEIVVDGKTGLLFKEPCIESLTETVQRFEKEESSFLQSKAVANSRRFSKEKFQRQFSEMINHQWGRFMRLSITR
jgi:glycosyltransferase involved in cell wall biosynthesis